MAFILKAVLPDERLVNGGECQRNTELRVRHVDFGAFHFVLGGRKAQRWHPGAARFAVARCERQKSDDGPKSLLIGERPVDVADRRALRGAGGREHGFHGAHELRVVDFGSKNALENGKGIHLGRGAEGDFRIHPRLFRVVERILVDRADYGGRERHLHEAFLDADGL